MTAVKNGYAFEDLPSEEEVIERDFRTCDCALTYVVRKRHAALGDAVEIRVCCMAKKVEELAGMPPGSFFNAIAFKPSWEWDCDQVSETEEKGKDGSVVKHTYVQGPPPAWLLKRMLKKGIPVHNLEKHKAPKKKYRHKHISKRVVRAA